jgi:UDP-N-acetylglucosamine--N-acetylmuramyl-(pentapeptide) pyrophosphoryl-undecaprenol N-acetylglucosamine transferase
MKIVIAAGGTGGHIFPALSVALQFKKTYGDVSFLWIGTARSREKELCERHGIPIVLLDVAGFDRKISVKAARALLHFAIALFRVRSLFIKDRPSAIIAFGGYVCAPVLGAARLASVPYFIQEQNTVPGIVNRFFSGAARMTFLGFPIVGKRTLRGRTMVCGTPVRQWVQEYEKISYPRGFSNDKKTILICGGSQGAQSMNACLIEPVERWLAQGLQVVWQTGNAGHTEVVSAVGSKKGAFIFPAIDDLYPYYAVVKIVIGRAGASTLAEIAYFGLPCVVVPLPWATENHQWINAGIVETQGWGIRVRQDEQCGSHVEQAVGHILNDAGAFETMSGKALDHSPSDAVQTIVKTIISEITG